MKLFEPRGFAVRSFVDAIGENAFMFGQTRPVADEPDPLVIFGIDSPVHSYRKNGFKIGITATPLSLSFISDTPELRTIWMPFSPPRYHQKKNGERTKEKWKLEIQTATVTVVRDIGKRFLIAERRFAASNLGHLVHDHVSSRPLAAVRADLRRMLGAEEGDRAANVLAAVARPGPREPKPDTRQWSAPAPVTRALRPKAPKAPKAPVPDFAAMTAKQLAAFNRKQSKQAHADMATYLSAGLPKDWESLPVVRNLPSRSL